jgi:predicted metal-dependent peptidase
VKYLFETNLTAEEKITKLKIELYDETPFLSYIINHLKTIKDNNMSMPTMGVDSKGNLYYDEKFVKSLSMNELKGCISHEALHCAFQHLSRLNERDKEIWNIAADIIVNNFVIAQGYSLPKGTIIPFNNKFVYKNGGKQITINDINKKIVEGIYNELLRIIPEKEKQKFIKGVGGFDTHINSKEKTNGKGSAEVESVNENEIDWNKVISEANTYAKQKGKGSSDLDRMVDAALNKKISWKALLSRYMTNEIASNYSYARPSKRSYASGVYLPYLSKQSMNITIAIDTSGSINNKELSQFMGQIYMIVRAFNNLKLEIIFHDDKIVKTQVFNNMNLRNITKINPVGGGGTSHKEVMEYANNNNVNVLVCFTDGYSDINYCKEKFKKTIFVITSDSSEKPKYGKTIYFKEETKW